MLYQILKLGTNVINLRSHCIRKNELPLLISSFLCRIFFLLKLFFVTDFLASVRATVYSVCIHLENGQVYAVGKKTKRMRLILALFLPFFIFSHLSLVLKMRKFVSSQVAMLLG